MTLFLAIIGSIGLVALAITGLLWVSRYLHDIRREHDLVFLQILIPKKESKEDKETESEKFSSGKDFKEVLGVMDHLYQSLHSICNGTMSRHWRGQQFFSLEYAALAAPVSEPAPVFDEDKALIRRVAQGKAVAAKMNASKRIKASRRFM